jgi:peptide/nickel transport system permease protein
LASYIVRRILQMVPVIVLVSAIAFSLLFVLPGDPALAILGEEQAKNQQLYQQLRAELGLDRPLPVQYVDWASRVVRGDLGTSTRTQLPVSQLLVQRIGPTVQLSAMAMLLGVLVAIPVGIISAVKPNSRSDVIGTVLAMIGASIPPFWLGLLLILLFALWLRWLPPSGYVPPTRDLGANLALMVMPTITLAGGIAAIVMRQTRSAMLEVLRQDYVTTARAKGLVERVVLTKHALRNALIPIVTIIGLEFGHLMGGAVITETIFSVPGVGRLAADSIFQRDFPVLQAVVLLLAFAVLLANLLTDIAYAWLDPRIRYR